MGQEQSSAEYNYVYDFTSAVSAHLKTCPPRGWTSTSKFNCDNSGVTVMLAAAPTYKLEKMVTPGVVTVRKLKLQNKSTLEQSFQIKEILETKLESQISIEGGEIIPGVQLPLRKPQQLDAGSNPILDMNKEYEIQTTKSELSPYIAVKPKKTVYVSILGNTQVWQGHFEQRVRFVGNVKVNLYNESNIFFGYKHIAIEELGEFVENGWGGDSISILPSGIEITYSGHCTFQVQNNTDVEVEEMGNGSSAAY